jgi:O-antigen ligase
VKDNWINTNNLDSVILFLIFAETFLLPFWHLGPVPFKFSFFYVIFYLIRRGVPKSYFIIPFVGIISLLWIGKIFAFIFYGEKGIYDTFYATMNYGLIILGFLYALKLKPVKNLNWLMPLIVLFSILNLYVFAIGPSSPRILIFYGLMNRLEEGLFLVRNPGVFTNPNSSALAGNCLLIFWVVARKFKIISYKKGIVDTIVFVFIALALLSFQSRGGFLAFGATLLYFAIHELNIKSIFYTFGIMILFLILAIGIVPKIFPDQIQIFEVGINKVLQINAEINGEIGKDNTNDGSRLYKIKAAFENVPYSPIFGVGSDRTSGIVLNNVWYHNDWLEMLVSTGILGFFLLLLIFIRVYKLNAALAIPFIFGGMTNSFIVTVQIVMFYFLFIGLIIKKTQYEKRINS